MGFFKDFKADLSQAVNELSDDAAKFAGADETVDTEETVMDDVMVDTLTEAEEEIAFQAALDNVTEQPIEEVEVAEDGWTIVTADGKVSCHEEHTVAVFEDHTEVLTDLNYCGKSVLN